MSAEGISLKVQVYSVFQGYLVLQHLQMMQIWIRLLPVCQVPSFPNLTLLASIFFPSLFPLGYLLYAVDIGGKINVSDMVSLSPYNPARNKWTQVKPGTLSIWMGMVYPRKFLFFLGTMHFITAISINKAFVFFPLQSCPLDLCLRDLRKSFEGDWYWIYNSSLVSTFNWCILQ